MILNLGPELVKDVEDADGITAFEAELEAEVPTELVAVTANVYDTPFVKPRTCTVPGWLVVVVILPGVEVIVYSVTEAPPSLVGAENDTVAEPCEGEAKPITGDSGTTALAV